MAWAFLTSRKTEVKRKLPKLNVTVHIFALFHISSKKSNYNVIFDQDYFGNLELIYISIK